MINLNFHKALIKILKHEGGYVNDPDDSGGETYKGIARRYNPDWPGWDIIDTAKKAGVSVRSLKNTDLDLLVVNQYREKYWNPYKLDQLDSPEIAEQLFDMIVNLGGRTSIKLAQKSVNELIPSDELLIDGVSGPKTIKAINDIPTPLYNNRLLKQRIDQYWRICRVNAKNYKFLRGWTKRAMNYLMK